MSHHRIALLATTILLFPLVAGCSSSSDSAPTGTTSSKCLTTVPDSALITAGTLTVVTNATLPPLQYLDSSGQVVGMRIDMAKDIAKQLCLKLDVINAQFDAQIPGVQGKRWDMINTGMFYTAARADTITMVPYEEQVVAIGVAKGNPKGIHTVDDLAGHSVSAEVPGYEYDTVVALQQKFKSEGKSSFTIRGFNNTADAFQAVASGQVDAIAAVSTVLAYYQKKGEFEQAIGGLNPAPVALGFNKSNTVLADAVAKALGNLRTDGTLKALFEPNGAIVFRGDIKVTTGPLALSSTP